MRIQTQDAAGWAGAAILPQPLDSETASLLRLFLGPVFENATDWHDLSRTLADKGYGLGFRQGRMVLLNGETKEPVCTGQAMGMPLSILASRLGRPCIRAHANGETGELQT